MISDDQTLCPPSLSFGKLQPRFGFADDFEGLGVFVGVVAGFIPHLLTVLELRPHNGDIDLFLRTRAFNEDRHALGQHFNEAASDAVFLLTGFPAVQADHSGCDHGKQRRVTVKGFEVAGSGRHLDRIYGLIDEDAIRDYQPDL